MAKSDVLSFDEVNELLDYDKDTGIFRWKVKRNKNFPVGSVAGSNRDGYIVISLGKNNMHIVTPAHRLAWLLTFGKYPEELIDHINRVRNDNRISNLREATTSENHQNKGAQKNSKTGVKGVCFRKGRYVAQICDGKKRRHLGQFKDLESAAKRYADEVARIRTEFGALV